MEFNINTMGKKKKSFYKKSLKPLLSDNKLLMAALGGVAAGISLAGILGIEKARQIVDTLEGSVKDFSNKVKSGLNSDQEKNGKTASQFEREPA
jgi:hypothetical protein